MLVMWLFVVEKVILLLRVCCQHIEDIRLFVVERVVGYMFDERVVDYKVVELVVVRFVVVFVVDYMEHILNFHIDHNNSNIVVLVVLLVDCRYIVHGVVVAAMVERNNLVQVVVQSVVEHNNLQLVVVVAVMVEHNNLQLVVVVAVMVEHNILQLVVVVAVMVEHNNLQLVVVGKYIVAFVAEQDNHVQVVDNYIESLVLVVDYNYNRMMEHLILVSHMN
jgi:hypothetical protein